MVYGCIMLTKSLASESKVGIARVGNSKVGTFSFIFKKKIRMGTNCGLCVC